MACLYIGILQQVGHNKKPQARKPFLGETKSSAFHLVHALRPVQYLFYIHSQGPGWLFFSLLRPERKTSNRFPCWLFEWPCLTFLVSLAKGYKMTFPPGCAKALTECYFLDQRLNPDTWQETPSPNYWTTREFPKIALTLQAACLSEALG